MIDEKLAILTIHDVNPSHSKEILTVTEQLNKLKIKYNLSIVPYYNKKYRLEGYKDFCKEISSLFKYGNIDLTLHGLYHEVDGKIEDFDTESKEEEKKEIQEGLEILSSVNLPRPSMFIPPAWHLSRQCFDSYEMSIVVAVDWYYSYFLTYLITILRLFAIIVFNSLATSAA